MFPNGAHLSLPDTHALISNRLVRGCHGSNEQIDERDEHEQQVEHHHDADQRFVAHLRVLLIEVGDAQCQAEEEEM